jgi:hypothetical protein
MKGFLGRTFFIQRPNNLGSKADQVKKRKIKLIYGSIFSNIFRIEESKNNHLFILDHSLYIFTSLFLCLNKILLLMRQKSIITYFWFDVQNLTLCQRTNKTLLLYIVLILHIYVIRFGIKHVFFSIFWISTTRANYFLLLLLTLVLKFNRV